MLFVLVNLVEFVSLFDDNVEFLNEKVAELGSGFRKASLWITLCKTFLEAVCKSLIDGEIGENTEETSVLGICIS